MVEWNRVENAIRYVLEDTATPRSVREKLNNTLQYIKRSDDEQTKISTILSDLDELSQDVNIPPFVRTQLYSISGMLEQN